MQVPERVAAALVAAGRWFDRNGWVPATAGNFSARLPGGLVAITRSSVHKGQLSLADIITVDMDGRATDPAQRPSAETLLHCGIYRRFPEAGAVLHGHSVADTVLSRLAGDGIRLAGYELLKVFPGLPTHEAEIRLPVFDNDQDMARLQAAVDAAWDRAAMIVPGYVIRGHGTYVWARDVDAARHRFEALEFLLRCEMEERRLR
ncbi:MAG: methylthioribulose 1-phosphate dehydratase [Acetobacteraceae bacterium]|nr:methylthioribulose 1-phosphate dehydratase [Acetobacteraceae bacterium]MDW8397105.1 methylthioribulose 1-phosphate dehydratase [Acetobacteraceae bacterium]